jgi:hypothetical protein
MTTTPDEPQPLRDEDIETVGSNPGGQGVRDADGTDGDSTDSTDGDSTDADGTDA